MVSADISRISVVEQYVDVVNSVFSGRVVHRENTLDGLFDDFTVSGQG